jgi:hypothetical protein
MSSLSRLDLLNGSLQGWWVGANDLGSLLAILEDDEGWHGADAELLGDFWDVVNVDLDEVDVGELLGELDDDWGDGLAWAAPGGEGIKDDDVVGLEGLLVLLLAEWLLVYVSS